LRLSGVPAGLLTQIPWPSVAQTRRVLDDPVPTVERALTGGLSDTTAIVALAIALWVLWAAFTLSVLVELAAAIRGVPVPHYRLLGPTQTLAGWLLAGVLAASPIMGTVSHAAPPTVAASPVVPTSVQTTAATDLTVRPAFAVTTATATATRSTTVASVPGASRAPAATRPVYRVEHGDWMVMVAERFLGDQDRYPEIAQLNPRYERQDHRFPDHWEPGWEVVLPDDAYDRGPRLHATGHLVVTAPPAATPPGGDNDSRRPPGPGTPPSAAPGPSSSAAPSGPPAPASLSPSAAPSASAGDQDGVSRRAERPAVHTCACRHEPRTRLPERRPRLPRAGGSVWSYPAAGSRCPWPQRWSPLPRWCGFSGDVATSPSPSVLRAQWMTRTCERCPRW